jgi:hypothetical protein
MLYYLNEKLEVILHEKHTKTDFYIFSSCNGVGCYILYDRLYFTMNWLWRGCIQNGI